MEDSNVEQEGIPLNEDLGEAFPYIDIRIEQIQLRVRELFREVFGLSKEAKWLILFLIVIIHCVTMPLTGLVVHLSVAEQTICNDTTGTGNVNINQSRHELLKDVICLNHNPYNYTIYHLNEERIAIDGKMDDQAWKAVNWSEYFSDIRGNKDPPPVQTRLKMRWDDSYLYILVIMEEANITEDVLNSQGPVPNTLQVLCDLDGTMHNYKYVQVDTAKHFCGKLLQTSYVDSQCPSCRFLELVYPVKLVVATVFKRNCSASNGPCWTIEMAIPFSSLAKQTTRFILTPEDGHVWFFNVARKYNATENDTGKTFTADQGWWSWQPMYTENIYIPSRFGYVQFRRNKSGMFMFDDRGHNSLFEIYESQKRYKAVNGLFARNITYLDIEYAKCLSQYNATAVIISASQNHFEAEVQVLDTGEKMRINQDRRVSYFKGYSNKHAYV